jgi:ABC-2 type transport system ATP-binding protein
LDRLREVLTEAGVEVADDEAATALLVRGAASEVVGDLAARNGITLHELSSQQLSLEDAYMKLTDDAVQYRAAT